MNAMIKNGFILLLLVLGLSFNLACGSVDGTLDINENTGELEGGDASTTEDEEMDEEELDEEMDEEELDEEEMNEEVDPNMEDPEADPAPQDEQPADNSGNNNADNGNQASDQQLAQGAALYSSSCSGCHGPLDRSNVKDTTVGKVQRAIDNNDGGMGFLSNLSVEELESIVGALSRDGTIR